MKKLLFLLPALTLASCRGVRLQTPVEVSKVQSPVVVEKTQPSCDPVYRTPTPDGRTAQLQKQAAEDPFICDPKTGNCYLKPEFGGVCGPVTKSEEKEPGLRKCPPKVPVSDDTAVMVVLTMLVAACGVLIVTRAS